MTIGGGTPDSDGLGYVSLELTARVAGVALAEVQRIAADFAKGRPREPWFGARLVVRTEKVLGRRHRDIWIASLPAALRDALATNRFRFVLAAEQAMPGAELGPADFMLLHRASQSDFGDPDFFNANISFLRQGGPLLSASRERFDHVVDTFYGWGFRDHALPGVSADYLDFLDRSRRYLGMGDRYYACVLVELAGIEQPRHLDGAGFVRVANFLMQLGLPWTVPDRNCMSSETIGILNESCEQLGLPYHQHSMEVTAIGGGAIRPRDLDVAGWLRVRAARLKAGYRQRGPAPSASGQAGFVEQPTINVIWRLWWRLGGKDGDRSAEALDRWLGGPGALAGLTLAGARGVLDELLTPLIELRLAAVAALENAQAEAAQN